MDLEQKQVDLKDGKLLEVKLYRIRWIVVGVFAMCAAASSLQWVQYSIIANIIMKFYGVSAVTVDWTSMIAMIMYSSLIIPGTFLVNKIGLRYCALLGVIGTTLGAWIKVFSAKPDLLWVGFLGQTVVFTSQTFILSLPPKIAAVWFGPNEASTACSIGIFGTQAGISLGFILPPLIVRDNDNLEDIGKDLSHLFYTIAAFCTIATILTFLFFNSAPPLPPSKAQAKVKSYENTNVKEFWKSYKMLVTDKYFLLLMFAYGISSGVFLTICTLLNQFVLEFFENGEQDAGFIGFLLVIFGTVGVVVFGIVLDKTKKYKLTAVGLYIATVLTLIAFMVALTTYSKPLAYISGSLFGFFQNAYYGVGIECGVELTYPLQEYTSSGLLIATVQTFGFICILLLGQLLAHFGALWALSSMIGFLILGTIITVIIPNRTLRQDALKESLGSNVFSLKTSITNTDCT